MDLIKIGKYIAGKRKDLGMTQKQLAEKLGMSDKSVSKWERGVCLPDVSVYSDLCKALGISITEFLAGEDIEQENIIQKSEENVIGVSADSVKKQKKLGRIITALTIVVVALLLIDVTLGRSLIYHWVTTVSEKNRDELEKNAAEYMGYEDLTFVKVEKKADYMAALCQSSNDKWCMCIFERDKIYSDRWSASGGVPDLNEGEIESWGFNDSRDTVFVYAGYKMPDEVRWYQFMNEGHEYTCPVQDSDRMALDLFIFPDSDDLNCLTTLLDRNREEIK